VEIEETTMGFAAGIDKALRKVREKIGGDAQSEIVFQRYDPTLAFEDLVTVTNGAAFVLEDKEPGVRTLFVTEQGDLTEAMLKVASHVRYDGKTWVFEERIEPANDARLWRVKIRFQQTRGTT
jgi:hypothetical protein